MLDFINKEKQFINLFFLIKIIYKMMFFKNLIIFLFNLKKIIKIIQNILINITNSLFSYFILKIQIKQKNNNFYFKNKYLIKKNFKFKIQ